MGNCFGFTQTLAKTNRREGKRPMSTEEEINNLKEFRLADLKRSTKNFTEDLFLGEGDSGKVYKGWIDETSFAPSKTGVGMAIAIKRMHTVHWHSFQRWQPVINFLRGVAHPNVVKVFGYCWKDNQMFLVYEFMERGSLPSHLFSGKIGSESLSWESRLKIAIGVARGLSFLHTKEKKIIFKNFKASNILLDANYNAKLSGIGLAELRCPGDEQFTLVILPGYEDSETMRSGKYSMKTDVYRYGVLLLELLTGLRAFDYKRPEKQRNLADWMKPILSNEEMLKNVVDVRMEGQYSATAMMQAAQISSKCIGSKHENRPSMNEVVEALEQIQL